MNGTSEACRRNKRYHKSGSVWLDCLRVLWRRGWGARRIAETLTQMSASACRQWIAAGHDDDALDALLVPRSCDIPWTARQVRHHARRGRKAGGKRRRPDPETRTADPRRRYACEKGFLHLLPQWETGKGWQGGVDLSRRDVDVLSALREHGPLTRGAIADALQLHGTARRLYNRRGRPVLGKLRRHGLVEITTWQDGRPVYEMASSPFEMHNP